MTYGNVSANIAYYMARAGIGKSTLAKRLCISPRTLYARLESPKQFTLSEMENIAAALRVNVSELLFGR